MTLFTYKLPAYFERTEYFDASTNKLCVLLPDPSVQTRRAFYKTMQKYPQHEYVMFEFDSSLYWDQMRMLVMVRLLPMELVVRLIEQI